jgi:hypothetical protein
MAEILLTSYETVGDEGEAVGDSASVDYAIAQSFQIPRTTQITKLGLYTQKGTTPPTDPMSLFIWTDTGGVPNPGAGELTNIPAGDVPASYDWAYGTITPITLTGNTTYWFVAAVPPQAANKRFEWLAKVAGGYTLGKAMKSTDGGLNWSDLSGRDCMFKIYGKIGGGFLFNFL